ncbi:hypothetical protein [Ferrovum myxofaciens]|nr:hypothetical protein [Ferrovum myxofaciens]
MKIPVQLRGSPTIDLRIGKIQSRLFFPPLHTLGFEKCLFLN